MLGQMRLMKQWVNMFKHTIFFMLVIMVFEPYAHAADLVDIYNRSLLYNNDLKVITNNHEISKEIYNQTSSSIFPEVSITATTQENYINRYTGSGNVSDYTSDTATVNIKQPIIRIYFFDELNKAESILDKSEISIENYRRDLMIKSTELYFALVNAQNRLNESKIKNNISLLRFNNAKNLFNNGFITDVEFNKYKNEYRISNVDYQISDNNLVLAKQDIYLLTGKDILEVNNLNPMIDIPLSFYDKDLLINKAMNSFDSIKLAMLDVSISQDEIKSNKSQHYPTLDFTATYDYSDITGGSRLGQQTRESNTIGLTLNIPIYQGGYQSSKVNEARYKYENSKLALDQLRRNIKKDIINNVNTHNILKNLMLANKENYLSKNEDYKTIKNGQYSGIYTDVELSEAEYGLNVARNDLIETTLNYLIVDLKLKNYSSELNIKNIKQLNDMFIW